MIKRERDSLTYIYFNDKKNYSVDEINIWDQRQKFTSSKTFKNLNILNLKAMYKLETL